MTEKQILTGSDTIVKVLAEQGVETIFGYSGGAILPTYDAVFQYNEIHKNNPMPPVSYTHLRAHETLR